MRPPKPPSVRDKSRRRAACSRRRGTSTAAAALRRIRRRRHPCGSESHVGQQPLGAGIGPARMPRPLCEAKGSPTRPGPAAPGRAEAVPLAGRTSGLSGRPRPAPRPHPLSPLLPGPRNPAPRSLLSADLVFLPCFLPLPPDSGPLALFLARPRFFSRAPPA